MRGNEARLHTVQSVYTDDNRHTDGQPHEQREKEMEARVTTKCVYVLRQYERGSLGGVCGIVNADWSTEGTPLFSMEVVRGEVGAVDSKPKHLYTYTHLATPCNVLQRVSASEPLVIAVLRYTSVKLTLSKPDIPTLSVRSVNELGFPF